jgi:hypothetical protein
VFKRRPKGRKPGVPGQFLKGKKEILKRMKRGEKGLCRQSVVPVEKNSCFLNR